MKKPLTFSIVILLLTLLVASVYSPASVVAETKYKVSGYVLDSNGNPIAGADVIFNVPNIVPGYITDSNGYYEMNAPAGTYHVNVWPPFDGNYISYDEPNLVVSSDMAKNITLQSGYKISGYVTDANGTPMTGAVVFYGNYGSGYFTNNQGYYFLSAPAGTYTITARPRTGTYQNPTSQFPTYTESNVVVSSALTKNITVSSTSSSTSPTPTPAPTYKISGYILDSTGHGISGANIIFNVPSIVPSVYSDASGYFQMYAPAGTYHVNVWPPFDSNYINYDEASFIVSANTPKNITLQTGCKVSGYVTNSEGTPMVGAVVLLGNYGSGYFTNSQGYYFLSVPAGTYRIDAHPRIGTYQSTTSQFTTYIEEGFQVTTNTVKNITVTQQTTTPSPTNQPGQSNPTSNPTQNPAPTATPQPNLPPTHITIQTDASTYKVGSALTVSGTLTSQNGDALPDKTVILSYAVTGSQNWVEVGSAQTNTQGQYSIQWLIEAQGTFTLKASYQGDNTQQGTQDTTTVSFLPYQEQKVFFVESNSTVTGLDFDSQTLTLAFSVSGETGSTGYTKITIAKTLVADFTSLSVSIDKTPVFYNVYSSGDYWILEFNYHHSTHQVSVGLNAETQNAGVDFTLVAGILAVIAVAAVSGIVVIRRRKHSK